MAKKEEFYKWIKIAGLASFIPFILFAGPLGGYFIGLSLTEIFHSGRGMVLFSTLFGLAAGLYETIRVIRVMIKAGGRN